MVFFSVFAVSMLKMAQAVDAGLWKGAARRVVLFYRIFHREESRFCTGQIATTIFHQNPCLAIRLFRVNSLSKYL